MDEPTMTQAQIHAAAHGDREAAAHLVRQHYADVFRFCARRIGHDLAADAAQETFLTMTKSLARFEGRSDLRTWLFGIAYRHCHALSRKTRREPSPMDASLCKEPSTGSPCPIEATAVRDALGKLSNEHREVVLLHEVDGLTYSEIAETLGIPVGTVKSRLYHALAAMRRTLEA